LNLIQSNKVVFKLNLFIMGRYATHEIGFGFIFNISEQYQNVKLFYQKVLEQNNLPELSIVGYDIDAGEIGDLYDASDNNITEIDEILDFYYNYDEDDDKYDGDNYPRIETFLLYFVIDRFNPDRGEGKYAYDSGKSLRDIFELGKKIGNICENCNNTIQIDSFKLYNIQSEFS